MRLGEMLDTRRRALSLSPEEAAAKLGISRRQWDRIVKGDSFNVRPITAARMKIAFNVDTADADEVRSLIAA